jgi:polyribonucleotide nucleotidyltransferase
LSANTGFAKTYFHDVEYKAMRDMVLNDGQRLDGRATTEVRPIWSEVDYLPGAHGSAVFTRGETQSLTTVTLGTSLDANRIDDATFTGEEKFYLHYNFPPFSTGEARPIRGVSRREIGHGNLAQRALYQMVDPDNPFTIRVVSDILESNGSSSMATVCAGTLAMMDAGVKLVRPVSGIAMGLISDGEKFAVLSDILGDEDHLGDMDFKVAGTSEGITALQMDIKIEGINQTIMTEALAQAHGARIHILDCMSKAITSGRDDVSKFAPKFITFKINTAKIREVIGRGGATIREITEKFGVVVDIDDTGIIKISSANSTSANEAKEYIDNLIADVEVGGIYEGKIIKIMDFGAFVSLIPGKDGFLHISQISKERVYDIHDVLTEGESVKVKVVEIDKQGRVRVSKKDLEETKTE